MGIRPDAPTVETIIPVTFFGVINVNSRVSAIPQNRMEND
jgi:TctA family transporter